MKTALLIPLILFVFQACTVPKSTQSAAQSASIIWEHYQEWKGTWYRYGGVSKSGVDCSGYIYKTFQECFSCKIPRTTQGQMQLGRQVGRAHLKAGDLIFFKTGRKQHHVGVYIANGKFTHASSSRGVIVSSLDNPYWRKHYLFAKRILTH